MMTLQNVQIAAPVALPQARSAGPVETAAAVKLAEAADRARGDMGADPGQLAEREAERARERALGPEEPVGPPPSFSANVLEAERARLKEGELDAARREAKAAESRDTAEAKDSQAEAPQPTRSAYGGVREDAPRMLDLSR